MAEMRDFITIIISVDEVEYREKNQLIRFDDDPEADFLGVIDSRMGTLRDLIAEAAVSTLSKEMGGAQLGVTVEVKAWGQTARARRARGADTKVTKSLKK